MNISQLSILFKLLQIKAAFYNTHIFVYPTDIEGLEFAQVHLSPSKQLLLIKNKEKMDFRTFLRKVAAIKKHEPSRSIMIVRRRLTTKQIHYLLKHHIAYMDYCGNYFLPFIQLRLHGYRHTIFLTKKACMVLQQLASYSTNQPVIWNENIPCSRAYFYHLLKKAQELGIAQKQDNHYYLTVTGTKLQQLLEQSCLSN